VLCTVVTLGQNYQAFLANKIDWVDVAATYIGLPLFLVVWLGYSIVRKCRRVRYEDMEIAPWIERQMAASTETSSSAGYPASVASQAVSDA
jgi:lysine-specific permease